MARPSREAPVAPARPAVLEVEDLFYTAGSARILDRVSFELGEGQLAVVMGASGSGKTTLLKCLNRLIEPQNGRVRLDGTDARSMAPTELRRRIGMVWQVPFMFPGSVRDNLRRAGEYGRRAVDDEDCTRLLRQAGFDGSLDRDSRTLSTGQQQRVSVARALVCRPRVLLCDEPTASLDEDASLHLEATMSKLASGGMTIVFVTHDGAQARRIADRRLLLSDGVVREVDPTADPTRAPNPDSVADPTGP